MCRGDVEVSHDGKGEGGAHVNHVQVQIVVSVDRVVEMFIKFEIYAEVLVGCESSSVLPFNTDSMSFYENENANF